MKCKNCGRVRRKIQNEEHRFLPSESVLKHRSSRREKFKTWAIKGD